MSWRCRPQGKASWCLRGEEVPGRLKFTAPVWAASRPSSQHLICLPHGPDPSWSSCSSQLCRLTANKQKEQKELKKKNPEERPNPSPSFVFVLTEKGRECTKSPPHSCFLNGPGATNRHRKETWVLGFSSLTPHFRLLAVMLVSCDRHSQKSQLVGPEVWAT